MRKREKPLGVLLVKTMANIAFDLILSVIFLAGGALLFPFMFNFIITANFAVAVPVVVAVCVALALLMARIFR